MPSSPTIVNPSISTFLAVYDPVIMRHLRSLSAAVIFQRILWSIRTHAKDPEMYSQYFHGGRWWMHDTYDAFADYSSLNVSQVKRALRKLKDAGLIISAKINSRRWDQTNHYSIDLDLFPNGDSKKKRPSTRKAFEAYNLLKSKLTESDYLLFSSMNYRDFLKTDYWHTVRQYKKSLHPSCALCSIEDFLHVHHKHYENRGREILFLEDLVVLCKFCHAKHHEKNEPPF